ncbi:MAG: hypothetical protein AAF639_27030, partial [Chloroflexota bacterium]
MMNGIWASLPVMRKFLAFAQRLGRQPEIRLGQNIIYILCLYLLLLPNLATAAVHSDTTWTTLSPSYWDVSPLPATG